MRKAGYAALGFAAGCLAAAGACSAISAQEKDQQIARIDKFRTYYDILNQWMSRLNRGEETEDFFLERQIHAIAIYGMGELGARLLEELEGSGVRVEYCMETGQPPMGRDGKALGEGGLKPVDAIIVTAVFAFGEIKERLGPGLGCPILSLEDIVFGD